MNILILVLTSLIFTSANAKEINFNAIKLNDIKSVQVEGVEIEIPMPTKEKIAQKNSDYISGEITELHLLAQASKKLIFAYADTQEDFNEFIDKWTPILNKAGLKPTKTEYKHTLGFQYYDSDTGYVLRDFWADKLNYDATASSEIYKLQQELIMSLEKYNLPTIAAFRIKHDIVRPTFKLYYMTKHNEDPNREIRLRHLMKGVDIDYDMMEKIGINIVRRDKSYSMVYIGKSLGLVSRVGKTKEETEKKLADYKKFLKENNKEFLAAKIFKLDEPVYDFTYAVHIYFYQ